MNALIYWLGRAVILFIQVLPLRFVVRLGRLGGALAFRLDARHRRVALGNLAACFGNEKSPEEILALAKENFRRIGENYLSAVKTAAMTAEAMRPHFEFAGTEKLLPPRRLVVAIGHFGNFEINGRFADLVPGYCCATTYRALNQPALNRLLGEVRSRPNCFLFERRTQGAELRAAMRRPNIALGLQTDQSSPGLRAPFLGRECNTTLAPAVFALRYHCELFTAICHRVGLAKWRLEFGEPIPTHENGRPRPSEDIMRDVNREFEAAVRRDPANWFWVHRRWKT